MDIYDDSQAWRFRELLERQETQLCAMLREDEQAGAAPGPAGEVHDFKDEAALGSEALTRAALAEGTAMELEQVLAARARLKAGTFGTCTTCGEMTDLRRLLAMPSTPHCADCQREEERRNGSGRHPAGHSL